MDTDRNSVARIPRDLAFDSSIALLSEGYNFIANRCSRYQSDLFETRLMGRKAICTMGADAAEMFYHPDRFTRVQALPITVLLLLQDIGSVQTLDGDAHRHRKQMFMSLMPPASIARLANLTAEQWQARLAQWERGDQVVLHDEARAILCRAVCQWAATPLSDPQAEQRTREFGAMIDGAGSVGPRNWQAILLRMRTERWARGLIAQVRARQLHVPDESALHVIAWHQEPDGSLLDLGTAGVELLNLLRPTVAVARFVTCAALALHHYPEWRQRLQENEDDLECFVQEVRRFYPFFPLVGGRVRQAFDWRGHHFTPGTWVLLDLYGTNHDARIWDDPHTFQPERFRHWDHSPYTFIPQGGGEFESGHRCAGEWITIELMKTAVRLLTRAMRYDVPDQDLRVDLSKMPALPHSGFVIRGVDTSPKSR